MLLGALTKQLKSEGLSFPRPGNPYLLFSFEGTVKKAREIQTPRWFSDSGGGYYHQQHDCQLESTVTPVLDSLENFLSGLDLKDFPSQKGKYA